MWNDPSFLSKKSEKGDEKGRFLLSGKVEFTAVRSIRSNLCSIQREGKEENEIRNIGGQMSILHDR